SYSNNTISENKSFYAIFAQCNTYSDNSFFGQIIIYGVMNMALKPITVKELAQKILANESVFLLDIRKNEDYNDWSIQGRNVQSMNIPFKQLENGTEEVKRQLPENQTIYVVCAKGVSSQKGVEILEEAGVENITYLEGGMEAWSEHLEPMKIGDLSDGGALYQFLRIGKGCLSYMIISNG